MKAARQERPRFETIVEAFSDAVARGSDHEAVRLGERAITYREYGGAMATLAEQLVASGARGQRVAIAMPNSLELPVAILAALAAGAQAALLNPAYPPAALAPLLRDAAPTILIGGDDPVLRSLAAEHGASYVELGDRQLRAWSSGPVELPQPLPNARDLATLMYTGGTTGVSKGVNHDHANLMRTVEGMEACWPTRVDEEVWLSVAPLFHIWGLLMGCLNPLYGRARLVLMPAFEPTQMARLLEQERVSVFGGGPAAIYNGLLAVPGIGERDLSALRVCPGGGSPFSDELLRRWEATVGVPICEAFGMSEAAPITANPRDGVIKPGSVGLPAPGMEVQIVAVEDGREPLPPGEIGEIRVRSSRVMLGYRNRPDETATTLIDGWMYTGDIGRLDDDGYLYIVDRKKDMLLVGGFNVYPREIDEVLGTHPDVHEAATVGVPDERKGELPVSFVVPVAGAILDEQELADLCTTCLVGYKRPMKIIVVDAIPRTPANKTDRKALRCAWADAQERAIAAP